MQISMVATTTEKQRGGKNKCDKPKSWQEYVWQTKIWARISVTNRTISCPCHSGEGLACKQCAGRFSDTSLLSDLIIDAIACRPSQYTVSTISTPLHITWIFLCNISTVWGYKTHPIPHYTSLLCKIRDSL